MLVLSRHQNEQIVINGGQVVLTVVEIRHDKVRLGFDADASIPIHRREVQHIIDQEGNRNDLDV